MAVIDTFIRRQLRSLRETQRRRRFANARRAAGDPRFYPARGQGLIKALVRSRAEWHALGHAVVTAELVAFERSLIAEYPVRDFLVPGYCVVDEATVDFQMDYRFCYDTPSGKVPNWRERMVCPSCRMNNRQRAMVHVARDELGLNARSRVYLTEQVSAVYTAVRRVFSGTIGSEFLGPQVEPGTVNEGGVRHEDVTGLSLPAGSVDAVLTFDVLEHVPDYRKAFAEFHRVLAPDGCLLFTIPFLPDSEESFVRAEHGANGELIHHRPPQYHGDPVRPSEGVLCYHDFGWDLLGHLREAGFADAALLAFRSLDYGYLGGWQIAFVAPKGDATLTERIPGV